MIQPEGPPENQEVTLSSTSAQVPLTTSTPIAGAVGSWPGTGFLIPFGDPDQSKLGASGHECFQHRPLGS